MVIEGKGLGLKSQLFNVTVSLNKITFCVFFFMREGLKGQVSNTCPTWMRHFICSKKYLISSSQGSIYLMINAQRIN